VPEITTAQFINNGTRGMSCILRNGNRIVQIMIEHRVDAVKGPDAICIKKAKQFLMDVPYTLNEWLVRGACPMEGFLHIIDNPEKRQEDLTLPLVSVLAPLTFSATPIVRQIGQCPEIAIMLNAKFVLQRFDMS
jgi:hypothetical protein